MVNSVWKSSADAVSMAERDHTFIHQPSDYFYLVSTRFATSCFPDSLKIAKDCGAGEWLGNDIQGSVLQVAHITSTCSSAATVSAGVILSRRGRRRIRSTRMRISRWRSIIW